MKLLKQFAWAIPVLLLAATAVCASEADLKIPDLHKGKFERLGGLSAWDLLFYGALVITGTLGISLYQLWQIHKQPAHKSMLDISEVIFQTCKTYLIQQGKFLLMLFAFIAAAIAFYLLGFSHEDVTPKAGDPKPFSPVVTLVIVLLFAL